MSSIRDSWLLEAGMAIGSLRINQKKMEDLMIHVAVVADLLDCTNNAVLQYRDPRHSSYFGEDGPVYARLKWIEMRVESATIIEMLKFLRSTAQEIKKILRPYDPHTAVALEDYINREINRITECTKLEE